MKESTLIQMAISILLLFLSSSSTFAYQLSLKNGFYWLTTRTSASLTALSSAASPYVPPLTDVKYRISEIVPKTEIESVRLRHIMVDSKEMADTCYQMIVSGEANFEDLVGKLSTCEHSRGKGGDLGWSFMENSTNVVEADQSAELFPRVVPLELLNAAYGMSKGNMQVVSSISATPGMDNSRRWHVVQLMDVMNKLSVTLLNRRREKFKLRQRKPLEIQLELDQTMTRSGADDETKDQLTYSIDTMGCQMNVADSERIEGQLSELGYRRVEESSKAKVVILNTCSIRDHAEQKVYSYLGPHAQRKRLGEDVALIVAGCVAQQEGEALVKRFPEVDVVMGPQYANRFGDLLDAVFDGNQVVATDPTYQTEDALPALRSRSDVTAFVNVIYGCNERCTYCVVPTTRGVEQSRTKEAIVAEVGELVKNGYKEVTLLGQNIDSWGR